MSDLDVSSFTDDELDALADFASTPETYMSRFSSEHLDLIERAARTPSLAPHQLRGVARIVATYRPPSIRPTPGMVGTLSRLPSEHPLLEAGLKTAGQVAEKGVGLMAGLATMPAQLISQMGEEEVKRYTGEPSTPFAPLLNVGKGLIGGVKEAAGQLGETYGEKGVSPALVGHAAGLVGESALLGAGALGMGGALRRRLAPGKKGGTPTPPPEAIVEPGATSALPPTVSAPSFPTEAQIRDGGLEIENTVLPRMLEDPNYTPPPDVISRFPQVKRAIEDRRKGNSFGITEERRLSERRRQIEMGADPTLFDPTATQPIPRLPSKAMDAPSLNFTPTPFQSGILAATSTPSLLKGGGRLRDIFTDMDAAITQKYAPLQKTNPAGYSHVVRTEASLNRADYQAAVIIQGASSGLSHSQWANVGRLLVDDIAKATKERNPTSRIPELSPADRATVMGDAKVLGAIGYLRENMTPEVEAMSLAGGVTKTSLTKTPNGVYVQMKPYDPAAPSTGLGRARPIRYTGSRSIMGVKQRKGTGQAYDIDTSNLIQHTYRDRTRRLALNDLTAHLADTYPNALGQAHPPQGMETWKRIPLKKVGGERWVPPDLAAAYDQVTTATVPMGLFGRSAHAAMSKVVGMSLMIPAEAAIHVLKFIGTKALMPGVGSLRLGKVGGAIVRSIPGFGPTLASTADVFIPSSPRFIKWRNILAEHGALRTRDFIPRSRDLTGKILHPAETLFSGIRHQVFGLEGAETRARVGLAMLIESAHPKMSTAEIALRVNNAMGTYVDKLMPPLVAMMKRSGIDPFAAAGVAGIRSGVRGMLGVNAAGFSTETLWQGSVGAMLAYVMAQKAVDPTHRWPWEIPGYQVGDIIIEGKGDKQATVIPMRLWAPAIATGLRVTGIRGAMNAAGNGGDPLSEAGRDIANTILARQGPVLRMATTATTGHAPYLTKGMRLLPIAPPTAPGEGSIGTARNRLIPMIEEMAPLTEVGRGSEGYAGGTRLAFKAAKLFGVAPSTIPPESVRRGSSARVTRTMFMEAVQDITYRAGRIADPKERRAFIAEEVARFTTHQGLQARARLAILHSLANRPHNAAKAYLETRKQEGSK